MDENICEQCGTRNEPGAQFCVECQAFLPWERHQETDLDAAPDDGGRPDAAAQTGPVPAAATPSDAAAAGDSTEPESLRSARPPRRPRPESGADQRPRIGTGQRRRSPTSGRTVERRGRGRADRHRTGRPSRCVPGGDEVSVEVQIFNLSPIVDAFRVTAPDAPAWLAPSAPEVRLLPNSNELQPAHGADPGRTLVPGRAVARC